MYKIIIPEKVFKQIEKLETIVQGRIFKTLERIRVRPETYVTKLVDDLGYKLRVGDYRVILDIDNKNFVIAVIKVGHRKNIYKSL